MQDADPYPLFEQRSEGDAEAQQQSAELQQTLQQQQLENLSGEPAASGPAAAALREGNEAEVLNKELTHSESGEGPHFPLLVLRTFQNLSCELTINNECASHQQRMPAKERPGAGHPVDSNVLKKL